MEKRNVYNVFAENAVKFNKKTFLSFEDKRYSYGESFGIVNRMARFMQSKGVKKGSKIVIMMGNSPEFVFSSLAVFACGAILIPINTFFKGGEAAYIINDSETGFIITNGGFSAVMDEVRTKCENIREIFSFDNSVAGALNFHENIDGLSKEKVQCDSDEKDTALFIYTSGTTGHPKGAMLTYYNILENVESFIPVVNAKSKDKFLVMLPMFHTYTFTTCIMLPVRLGASMIILASVMDMKKENFKKILLFQRPTFVLGVPQIYSALTKSPMPKWFIKLFYPIKIHISGGAPLPMEIFEQFKKKFGIPVIEGYGLSEASPVVAFNPLKRQKQGTVGKALPGVSVKVVNEEEMEVPCGEVGELIVKGPNVMQGYWRMPKATDDAIKNGWLFTGDFAKIDEEGYITIVDRKKDLIIAKGMNVYPREVEEVIYTFPGVEAAAVIGIPSLELGEMIAAYIQVKEGETVNEKELKAYLAKNLANFKLPRVIKIINNIPLTATGKVLKRELKEMVKNGRI